MNLTFDDYINELGLSGLEKADALDALESVAITVHKQFLLDIYDVVGEENWNAIKTSIKLGPALYMTTLKHLAPNYLDIYAKSQAKIFGKLKDTA
jgi:hypothetical protein